MIVSVAGMRAAEEAAFAAGASAGALMEIAGEGIAREVAGFFPRPGTFRLFYGKGHNGGDVLVAARHLIAMGWTIEERPASPESGLAPLTLEQLTRLRELSPPGARGGSPLVLADGLLGTGSGGAPRGAVADAIREINAARDSLRAFVVAADLPSGLDGDSGAQPGDCVRADLTVTLGFAKAGLLADDAADVVGRLALVGLPGVHPDSRDGWGLVTGDFVRGVIRPRHYDMHKGLCGRVAVVAGSERYPGAARIASAAAVRAGAGLVTLFVPSAVAPVLAAACIPEVMVVACDRIREIRDFPADVIAIGPGMDRGRDEDVLALVREAKVPMVVDADALNAVATCPGVLDRAEGTRIVTPHPGEMERLFPRQGRSRRQWASDFAAAHPGTTLLLKGSRTIILRSGRDGTYNTTGNPGMASGGMGDTLTGVLAALLGQFRETDPADLAACGAWLCGRAAECAIFHGNQSPESLKATDLIDHLGLAFQSLK